jgi:hypothetical protein
MNTRFNYFFFKKKNHIFKYFLGCDKMGDYLNFLIGAEATKIKKFTNYL